MTIIYHSRKDKVVEDILSRKVVSIDIIVLLLDEKHPLAMDIPSLNFMRLDIFNLVKFNLVFEHSHS